MYGSKYAPGYEVLSKTDYSQNLAAPASYAVSGDFPNYATMSYTPSEHEMVTDIKYGNFEPGYHNLDELRQSMISGTDELYTPSASAVPEGSGRSDVINVREPEVLDKDGHDFDEIREAQEEIASRKIKKVEFEEVTFFKKTRKTLVFEDR